jgi:hypothetical protein
VKIRLFLYLICRYSTNQKLGFTCILVSFSYLHRFVVWHMITVRIYFLSSGLKHIRGKIFGVPVTGNGLDIMFNNLISD